LKSKTRTELLLLFTVLIWALNFTVTKFSLGSVDPMSFNSFRFLLAVITMYLILRRSGEELRVHKGDWPHIIGLGILGHLLYQVLFIIGLDLTYAANGAIMLGTTPVWVALISRIFMGQTLRWIAIAGIVTAVVGVWLIMEGSATGLTLQAETILGDFTMLLSAVVFGLYTLLSRPLLKRYSPIQLSTLIMLTGGVGVVLAGIPWVVQLDFTEVSAAAWGGIVYSGVLSIAVAYMLWNYGIRSIGSVRTSTFQNLVPVMGLVFGVLLLREPLLPLQYVGAGLTVIGIILARKAQAPPSRK